MSRCHLCLSAHVETLIDFGAQALSNRYLISLEERESRFPFVLSQCANCGLMHIADPIPPVDLKPRFDWISYNEQEGHLDDLVAKICQLPGVTKNSVIGAVSSKDDSTVARFQRRGFDRTWRLELQQDLEVGDSCAGLETLQDLLSPEAAERIAGMRGQADVLVVRHILEHAHDLRRFIAALQQLVKPGGYLVFEVPDCTPALRHCDYTMFWEEHICYFTPEIFQWSLSFLGLPLVHYQRFLYANENSLVAIVQPAASQKPAQLDPELASALVQQGREYAAALPTYRQQIAGALADFVCSHGRIAVFGAGHLSCAWINLLGLGQTIEFVVDDHPKKKGLFMPGSRLPIRPSTDLLERNVRLCLLSLSPESEAKVVGKHQDFVERGGRFASVFPGKPNSFTAP